MTSGLSRDQRGAAEPVKECRPCHSKPTPGHRRRHRNRRRARASLRLRRAQRPICSACRPSSATSSLDAATRNTRAVLALAGRNEIPVWPGSATPLSNFAADARAVHGETGLGYAVLPEPPEPAQATHAVDAIVAAAHAHPGRLILVATGPLTNIALAVMREPELPRLVKRFVIMGGAYRRAGNVTPCAEFNIWHDPEAARIVFRAFGGPGGTPWSRSGSTLLARRPSTRATSPPSRRARRASRTARR